MICPKCCARLAQGSTICPICGTKIRPSKVKVQDNYEEQPDQGYDSDSDDDYVTVSWSEYTDASTTETALTLKGAASDTISFKIPEDAKAGQKIHLIVQAQDDGEHTLTHYQQVIITIK